MEAKIQYPLGKQMELAETMVDMVIDGMSNAAFLYGDPGTGKSSLVINRFNLKKKVQGEDYIFVKGVTRPMGLYRTLYEHQDAVVVFDDCDSAWDDDVASSILKAALDTSSGPRIVSFNSKAVRDSGIPEAFEFQGRIIFISNLNEDSVDPAVRSRSFAFGIFATRSEMVKLMDEKLMLIEPWSSPGDKREVLNYLILVRDNLKTFDLRTLVKAIRLQNYRPDSWRELLPMFV